MNQSPCSSFAVTLLRDAASAQADFTELATIDLDQVFRPTGFVSIVPFESWNFQAWYRDEVAGMPTSDVSDGVEVSFM